MTTSERLKEWIKTLNDEQKDNIIVELTTYAIESEYVGFYDTTKTPYYDCTGESLDGVEED